MSEILVETHVHCSPEALFDVIIDLRGQGRTFHQPMTMKLRLGTIDVLMRYSLTPQGASTHVQRVVTLEVPWPLKLVQPLLMRSFRVENQRTLLALKAYADTLA